MQITAVWYSDAGCKNLMSGHDVAAVFQDIIIKEENAV